jgi:pyridoxal phosphate enzyme (YggS family)
MTANMLTNPQFSVTVLAAIRERARLAAIQAGRPPSDITLIGVTKTQPVETIRAAIAAVLTDFGENYVQEAVTKVALINGAPITWHFIGQIQANKARPIAESFGWVHTIDRLQIAQRLSDLRPPMAPPLQLCIQVKLAAEMGKGGIPPHEVAGLALAIEQLPRVRLRGLMCIPPQNEDPAAQRRQFAAMRELKTDLNRQGLGLDSLSMGMTNDFESAILEGATHIRIGTALFGKRTPNV